MSVAPLLRGLRVIDAASYIAGPVATTILADLGAEASGRAADGDPYAAGRAAGPEPVRLPADRRQPHEARHRARPAGARGRAVLCRLSLDHADCRHPGAVPALGRCASHAAGRAAHSPAPPRHPPGHRMRRDMPVPDSSHVSCVAIEPSSAAQHAPRRKCVLGASYNGVIDWPVPVRLDWCAHRVPTNCSTAREMAVIRTVVSSSAAERIEAARAFLAALPAAAEAHGRRGLARGRRRPRAARDGDGGRDVRSRAREPHPARRADGGGRAGATRSGAHERARGGGARRAQHVRGARGGRARLLRAGGAVPGVCPRAGLDPR